MTPTRAEQLTDQKYLPTLREKAGLTWLHRYLDELREILVLNGGGGEDPSTQVIALDVAVALIRIYAPGEYLTETGGVGYWPETNEEFAAMNLVRKLIKEG